MPGDMQSKRVTDSSSLPPTLGNTRATGLIPLWATVRDQQRIAAVICTRIGEYVRSVCQLVKFTSHTP